MTDRGMLQGYAIWSKECRVNLSKISQRDVQRSSGGHDGSLHRRHAGEVQNSNRSRRQTGFRRIKKIWYETEPF